MNRSDQSKHPVIIDLLDRSRLRQLSEEVTSNTDIDLKIKEPIQKAVETIDRYAEANLSPYQINQIYKKMNVDETKTPKEMEVLLKGNDEVAIVRKKYYDSFVTKRKFRTSLLQIVSEFANVVTGNIISAIIQLVQNFSYICATFETFNTTYKDLCFRFFSIHPESQEVIVLILNFNYGEIMTESVFTKIISYMQRKVHLSFFGVVVKTNITPAKKILK